MITDQYWQLLASELQYPYSMVWQGASSAHSTGDARAVVRTEIQEDFTSVTISFDSLNVQTISQSAKYNVNTINNPAVNIDKVGGTQKLQSWWFQS